MANSKLVAKSSTSGSAQGIVKKYLWATQSLRATSLHQFVGEIEAAQIWKWIE